jgi:hypothetical protein
VFTANAPLIRFVGHEDGLLSHTHDGPRMYINIEGEWRADTAARLRAVVFIIIIMCYSPPRWVYMYCSSCLGGGGRCERPDLS